MFITVFQISATEATIARFRKQRSQLEFVEGARQRLADTALPELFASWRNKAQTDRIILSSPPSLFSIREVELPLPDRKKAREILPVELKGETALDSEEMIFEALPLAGGRYAAIWSSRSRLAPLIEMLAAAGLDPEIVTSSLFTWQHLVPAADTGHCALVDGEAVAVYHNGSPVYLRALPAAGVGRIAATLAAVELTKDIRLEQIFSCGGGDLDDKEVEIGLLPLNSGIAAAFANDTVAARDLATAYAAAADLAGHDPVNFRRGPLVFVRRQLELQRKLRLTALLAAIVVILLFLEAGVRYYLLSRDLASLDRSIMKMYRDAFPKRSKPVDEVAELKAEIKRLGAVSSQSVLTALKKLAEAKSDEINDLYEVDIDGDQVSGKGTARSVQAVNEFRAKCTVAFSGFEVSELKSRPDGSTGFAFRSAVKEAGK